MLLWQTVLAKYYIEILNIAKESADAKKLINFRAPHAAKQVKSSSATSACVIYNFVTDSSTLYIIG